MTTSTQSDDERFRALVLARRWGEAAGIVADHVADDMEPDVIDNVARIADWLAEGDWSDLTTVTVGDVATEWGSI